jgi:hypothetical protein
MKGNYQNSTALDRQHGTGIKLDAELNHQWGITAGYQATEIAMNPMTPSSGGQHQDNWLLSGYLHSASDTFPIGRWTYRLDAHQIQNSATQTDSHDVNVIAPHISWTSNEQPIKAELSYANSRYKYAEPIHQISPGLGIGLLQNQYWLQIRSTYIHNLSPERALGKSSTRSHEIQLTQRINASNAWMPTALTLGVKRGNEYHAVDMANQLIYNLPMLILGSETASAMWSLDNTNQINLSLNKTRYLMGATLPKESLYSLQLQLASSWK